MWTVRLHRNVAKQLARLPQRVQMSLIALIRELEAHGPVRGNWPNYGKLAQTVHHCHIKKGRPTYIAVWEETDRALRFIEVTYVGTHEKALY